MRRRTTRQSSSSSLHISNKTMSGIGSVPETNIEEPRVVVQTLPAVEPSEERLTPGPPATTPQHLAPEVEDQTEIIEVRTRLRPNRSSWRNKYSPPEEGKKAVPAVDKKPVVVPTENVAPGKASSGPPLPKPKAVVEVKTNKWDYMDEDMASIKRNTKLANKRERTPSTDSAPESPSPQKRRVKVQVILKPTGKQGTATAKKIVPKNEVKEKSPPPVVKTNSVPQHNGKVIPVKKDIAPEKMSDEAEVQKATEILIQDVHSLDNLDAPGFCEFCGGEYAFLNLHIRTNHSSEEIEALSAPRCKKENKHVEVPEEDEEEAVEISKSHYEAIVISNVVKQDSLIQKFGVRLLGMSIYPEQKVLAVSQRMIELVRLLKAAQGLDASIQNLAQLLHCDYWPLIIESIMYVAGYQQEDSSFRNPVFVFDVGQALKFAAFILKNDAISEGNLQLEQDLKDFMNSIEGKIDSILPGVSGFKSVHFLDSSGEEITDANKSEVVRTEVITTEEHQVQEILNTMSSGEQSADHYILPTDYAETMDPSYSSQSDFAQCGITVVTDASEGEEQPATLLLEFSQAQTSIPSPVVSQASTPQLQIPVEVKHGQQSEVKVTSAVQQQQQTKVSETPTLLKLVKHGQSTSSSNKVIIPNDTNVTILKIVSASTVQGQKKVCLLIPSQAVKKQQQLAIKRTVSAIEMKAASSPGNRIILNDNSSVKNTQESTTLPTLTDLSNDTETADICGLQLSVEEG